MSTPTFTRALTRQPCPEMVHGITGADLGVPDFEKALAQHAAYVDALKACGLSVKVLRGDGDFPDSTFVEDTALLTPKGAIMTNPGAPSRRGEIHAVRHALARFYDHVQCIAPPATLDAGDIMMVGRHFYIGLSERTTPAGAAQMIALLETYGLTGSTVEMNEMLHLKTGVSYLEHGTLVVAGEMVDKKAFKDFKKIIVDEDEAYAANCVWLNGRVLVPQGHPKTARAIEAAGYEVLELDVSEFQKLDGGLSCLSLRF